MSDKQKGNKNAWKRGIYSKAVLKNEKKLKIDLNSLDQELWLAKILLRRIVVGETLHNQQLQDQAAQNPDEGVTPVYNPIYNKFIKGEINPSEFERSIKKIFQDIELESEKLLKAEEELNHLVEKVIRSQEFKKSISRGGTRRFTSASVKNILVSCQLSIVG